MTLTLRPSRKVRDRIRHLPTATHDCATFGVWVRRPKTTGRLVCVVCGKP